MSETRLPPFTVAPSAIAAIQRLGGAVRVLLAEGGCCGTSYSYELVPADASPAPGDERFGCPGAWLDVSPPAMAVLAGATLSHGATLKPPRFRVLANPNTPQVCPCRRSFGAEWPGPGQPTCRSYEPMPWDDEFQPPSGWVRRTGWARTPPEPDTAGRSTDPAPPP